MASPNPLSSELFLVRDCTDKISVKFHILPLKFILYVNDMVKSVKGKEKISEQCQDVSLPTPWKQWLTIF